ncbi:ABC-type nitrate/sulfonate/bicarbonate transport system substrate-binding protein [Paenibacillus shirakamiensis]|uniref:ABC-type nitrate/sulfonate/bicarbonate transport system substrate-binding protein n=1 Tax=Paenibacillus shirakamiensis TaxID=1265935 RepID=A0ABS4JIS2_9BACL|nr:ABC transporter substrate-binding protein [Paenibacillus shirakamiensis]MBP2001597.1 ABC-type nitrate/sulfonate/bicarbonate transport system substrate-binding protein [Paenibacillus shirakamiensis]
MKKNKWAIALLCLMVLITTAGCGSKSSQEPTASSPTKLKDVKVVLDWTPNTNHTGLYVAKERGYYKDAGLNVEILKPGSGGADTMVATGAAQFGVSYQESITQGRIQNVPLVSIGAVIQHNTSGFAAPKDRSIKSPKDFEGKKYGGWGSPIEAAVMKSLMEQKGADVTKVQNINIGEADYFTAVKRDIDFAWIYYAWTGIEAELRGQPLDMLYVKDYSDKLDYYTPVIATSEKVIAEDPALVKAFMSATSKGYTYATQHPEDAGKILLKAAPELDEKLVIASQKWLSSRYQDDAPRWGEQKESVWKNYADWMYEHKLLDKPLEVNKAFTNDFLPSTK